MQFYNGSIEPPRLKLRCNTMLVHSVQYCKVQTIYKLLLFNQSISGMYHSYFEWQKLCTIYSEKLPPPERVGVLLFFVSISLRTLMMIKTHIRSTSLLTSETHFLSGKANAKAYYCIHRGKKRGGGSPPRHFEYCSASLKFWTLFFWQPLKQSTDQTPTPYPQICHTLLLATPLHPPSLLSKTNISVVRKKSFRW